MKSKLNEDILAIIKSKIVDREQIAPFLMNALFLGKEAVYRRIRGEVAFSFEEVATISTKLSFSIDGLVGLKQSERVFFDTPLPKDKTPESIYFNTMVESYDFFLGLLRAKSASGTFAYNHIPLMFAVPFDTLSKLYYYIWMRQNNGIGPNCAMSELVFPKKTEDLRVKWQQADSKNKMHLTYIFDNNLFATTCRDIDFYHANNLLTQQDVNCLRGELLFLVDSLELMTSTGATHSGARIDIYLLPFDLGANYTLFEYDNNMASQIHIHGIDNLLSLNHNACIMQKEWLDHIKRYSVFITKSGEMLRMNFFKKQREHIALMGQKRTSAI